MSPRFAPVVLLCLCVPWLGCSEGKEIVVDGAAEQMRLESLVLGDLPEAELPDGEPPPTEFRPWFGTWRGDGPVLAGTVVCVEPVHTTQADIDGLSEPFPVAARCYEEAVAGALEEALGHPRCHAIGEGESTWTWTFAGCPEHPAEDTLASDAVTLRGVAGADVSAAFVPWPEIGAVELSQPVDGAPFPEGLADPYGAEILLAEGAAVRLYASLFDADGAPVLWASGEGTLALEGGERVPDGSFDGQDGINLAHVGLDDGGWLRVRLAAGDAATATLSRGASAWEVATLRGVSLDEAASLDVVAVQTEEDAEPFAARAYVRDAEGRLIHGAPVAWSVDFGGVALSLDSGQTGEVWAGPDYVAVADVCSPPELREGRRSATLRATLGDLTDAAEMTWVQGPPDPDDDQAWVRSSRCVTPGCGGCSTASGGPSPRGGAVLGLLLLARRRRSRDGLGRRA